MRTVTRRGLLAGAMTVLTYAGGRSAFAADNLEQETLLLDVPDLNALPEQIRSSTYHSLRPRLLAGSARPARESTEPYGIFSVGAG